MPKFIAHRGLSMHAPENTIPAFEQAGQSGFWGIECDTYCTTDGCWIVHHDRTVDRMTDGSGRVKDMSFEQVRRLRIVEGCGIENYPELRIPTLQEVLDVCKRYRMHAFIEIEEYHRDRDLEELVALVERSGIMELCSFIGFNPEDLIKVRALNPVIPLGYLSANKPTFGDLDLVEALKPAFLDYDYQTTSTEDIKRLAKLEVEASIWTMNSPTEVLPYIEAGVTYITTDTILSGPVSVPTKGCQDV